VSTSTVRAWHRERGLSTEQSWHVLADLGQQMRVHRRSSGRLGLHQLPWMALNWRGRLVHLGRLQFDLHRAERRTARERWVIGSHTPAACSPDLAAVGWSLVRAGEYCATLYPYLEADRPEGAPRVGNECVWDPWRMNDVLPRERGEDSDLSGNVLRCEI